MNKVPGVAFGLAAYVIFLFSFLYAVGFVGNFIVPKSIDSGVDTNLVTAVVIDLLLLGAFAIQHSVMARPAFKAAWTRLVSPSIERSIYVLVSSLLLLLLFWQWRPLPQTIWEAHGVASAVLMALFWLGWLVVLLSTFMISHFDLFGLRQVLLNMQGKAYTLPPFTKRGFYRFVRHPIMIGFIVAFWAAPAMTLGHLIFALATTGYILIGIQFEEHDLANALGDAYRQYRDKVPMLLPWPRK